jgi:hypothetical protein
MFAVILPCFIGGNVEAQLVVASSTNYVQLVDSFISSGVSVSNVSYTGHTSACGYFSNGNSTNLGANSGVVLSTGFVADIGNGASYNGSTLLANPGNPLLTSLAGGNTFDAAVLEFDMVPAFDTLAFNFIYGSEDYLEWVGGNPQYQDHIGAFISGANPAGGNYSDQNFVFVPNTNLPVIVNNINDTTNSQYYVNNTTGSVMFDGFTTLLEARTLVVPDSTYHLTIAIADGGDQISDGGFFLESNSLSSYGTITGMPEPGGPALFRFYPNPARDKVNVSTEGGGTLTITNQLGQVVDVMDISDNQAQIATANFPPGIYLLTFETEEHVVTRELIVQR